jgi:D-aminoacyl-tRNA deacylase
MGNFGLTLSTSDPVGESILPVFREYGFSETNEESVLRLGRVYLFIISPLIVPSERYEITDTSIPYPVDYDYISNHYDIDYLIVVSRHWAKSGKPSLTVHPTGNFSEAVYGGNSSELQRTLANPMRNVFLELIHNPPKGFNVSLEATHHSPTQFETPMFFAELGSREKEWRDRKAAEFLAVSILNGVSSNDSSQTPVAIGFGGGHYCPKFSVEEKRFAFGHMAAKYALDSLNEDLIQQMVSRTMDGVDFAVYDSLKGYHKKMLEPTLNKLGIEIIN